MSLLRGLESDQIKQSSELIRAKLSQGSEELHTEGYSHDAGHLTNRFLLACRHVKRVGSQSTFPAAKPAQVEDERMCLSHYETEVW